MVLIFRIGVDILDMLTKEIITKTLDTSLNTSGVDFESLLHVISIYSGLLEKTRYDFNLIGTNEIIENHIIDSISPFSSFLEYAKYIKPPVTIADLGTGAGFPGIPLSILFSHFDIESTWYLIERSQKKISFLERVISSICPYITNTNLHPIAQNLREWKDVPKLDIVTSRAFKLLKDTVHDLKRIAPHATLLFYKGKKQTITEEFEMWVQGPNALIKIQKIEAFHHAEGKERHLVHAVLNEQ